MPTSATPLPVALLGVGRWGVHVLRDLRTLGCDVWAVARSDASVARAREGGAAGVVATVADLPPVRAAVVATPTSSHAAALEELLASQRVPIAVEKPLAADLASAERVAELGDGRVFLLDKWRYHPGVEELARIARSGELGEVVSLHSRRVTDRHRYEDTDTVWTHLPHDLAIAHEVLGDLPPAAWALAEVHAGERVGLLAALGGPPWVTVEVSCVAPAHRRELRVLFEGGVAHLDGGWAEHLTIDRRTAAEPERRPVPGELPLLAELRAFLRHVDGDGPPPRASVHDGLEIVRRIDELGTLAAAASGAPA